MKKEFIIIFFFFLFVITIVLSLKLINLQAAVSHLAQENELLSPEYVRTSILTQDGTFKDGENRYVFNNKEYVAPVDQLRQLSEKPPLNRAVLGYSSELKKIIVDLSHQRVYAYEGERVVYNFLVSTGKWLPTPVGHYRIWYKVRSQTMKGGNPAIGTYYYLPNVQWIQYFNNGIGFHSTYWHNNYGNPMSHGCVNMTTTDAETLYYWASPVVEDGVKIFRANEENPGTEVEVVDSWEL